MDTAPPSSAELATLWNRYYPKKFALDAGLMQGHVVDSPLIDWQRSSWVRSGNDLTSAAIVKRSPIELYAGPDPSQVHLSFLAGDTKEATAAILDATLAKNAPASKFLFGQDSRHFLPGVPLECEELANLLLSRGFEEGGLAVDLERDLSDYQPPVGCLNPLTGDVYVRRLVTSDRDNLIEFFDREFPARWKFDTMNKWDVEGQPQFVFGLFVDGQIHGFALTHEHEAKLPIGGAVWRNDLGANWGSLGPIGNSREVRGRGLGDALLGAALLELSRSGVRQCIIDWTTLVDFYGRHGFVVNRRYRPMVRTQS